MQLGSGVAVSVVQAGGHSSNSTLAWDPPYATGVGLKRPKNKQTNKQTNKKTPNKVSTEAESKHFLVQILPPAY